MSAISQQLLFNTKPVLSNVIMRQQKTSDVHFGATTMASVTEQTFQRDVIDASYQQPVMVDFYADWCKYCKELEPTLQEFADDQTRQNPGKVKVVKFDVDPQKRGKIKLTPTLQQYGIRQIPTVLVFENGKIKNRSLGAVPKRTLESLMK